MIENNAVLSKDIPLGFRLGDVIGLIASACRKSSKDRIGELEKAEGCLNGIIRKLKKESEVIELSTL